MFFRQFHSEVLEDASTITLDCLHCENTVEHVVVKQPIGPQLGSVFTGNRSLGCKQFFLACPICGTFNKKLTKRQARAMRIN